MPSAVSVVGYSDELAQDAAALLFTNGTHSGISFAYDDPNAKLNATVTAAVAPTGSVVAFAGVSAPTGWLLCDGAAVSRTIYVNLYNVIGTTYGVGDGSTTFNVPDLRGRAAIGS